MGVPCNFCFIKFSPKRMAESPEAPWTYIMHPVPGGSSWTPPRGPPLFQISSSSWDLYREHTDRHTLPFIYKLSAGIIYLFRPSSKFSSKIYFCIVLKKSVYVHYLQSREGQFCTKTVQFSFVRTSLAETINLGQKILARNSQKFIQTTRSFFKYNTNNFRRWMTYFYLIGVQKITQKTTLANYADLYSICRLLQLDKIERKKSGRKNN